MNLKDLERLKKEGKIRGWTETGKCVSVQTRSKYGNKKTVIDGIEFDSAKEAGRYVELRYLLLAGEIKCLERQVEFGLEVNGEKVASYFADFVYWQEGKMIVEDVKSRFTGKMAVYRLKKKLMRQCHGIEILET
jgi:hypothetical protein